MANYATLKAAIAAAIKQNGNNEITGNLLQQQLLAMVNSLGAGYQFVGVATPVTTPGTPDATVFYIAIEPGTYTNFNNIVVFPGEVAVLKWDSAWSKDAIAISEILLLELGIDGFIAPLGGYYITTVYTHGVNANMYCTKLLKVTPGEKFIFSGYFSSAAFPAVAGYADMQKSSPQTLVQSGNNVDVEITIPAGVNYIEAWGQKDHTLSLIKAEAYGSKSVVDLLFHEYLVESGLNYFDVGETGKYIAPGGGLGNNASYKISAFTETSPGRQYLYNGKNTSSGLSVVWGYAKKDRTGATALVPAGTIDGSLLFIVPAGVNYIQAQTTTDRVGILVEQEKKILTYGTTSGPFRDFLENNVVNPSKQNQYVILVQPGTYDLSSEITSDEISGGTFRGITLPDYTTLIGVAGPDATKFTLDIASNAISTLNLVETASLIGVTIEGKNCRYAVHDDFNTGDSGMERIVKHCKFIAVDCTYGFAYGGGLRSGQKWLFEDCYFDGNGGFLMHSNVGFTRPTELILRDCICRSIPSHPEKAIEIRGLAGIATPVMNYARISGCQFDGILLTGSNTYFDWEISICDCRFDGDISTSGTTYSPKVLNGNMKFDNGAPRWWNGTNWVDADGTII